MGLTITVSCVIELPIFHYMGSILHFFGVQPMLHLVMLCFLVTIALISSKIGPLLRAPKTFTSGLFENMSGCFLLFNLPQDGFQVKPSQGIQESSNDN